MEIEKLKHILNRSRQYATWANKAAEARHDDPDGEYYMDSAQYEIMKEAKELIKDVDLALKELEHE